MSASLLHIFEERFGRLPKRNELDDPYVIAELRRFGAADSYFSPDRLSAGRTILAFPRIKDDHLRVFLGGDQTWFNEDCKSGQRSIAEYAGCGAVAAANILAAFAYHDERLAETMSLKFYYDGCVAKSDFLRLMQTAYRVIGSLELPFLARRYTKGLYPAARTCKSNDMHAAQIPPSLGIWGARFQRGVLRLAASYQLHLQCHTLPTLYCDYEEGLRFLREGLASGSGVDIYTTFNTHNMTFYTKDYGDERQTRQCCNVRHHLVAVALRDNPEADDCDVLVSSWGQPGIISYRALHNSWQRKKAISSGMYYFTETCNQIDTRSSIRRARREWLISVWRLAKHWSLPQRKPL